MGFIFFSKAKELLRIIYEGIFCILPVKKNRIVFSSFTGRNYSCNQRAIYEYLIENCRNGFEYVWLFDYKYNPEIPQIVKDNAKCVQFNSVKSSYYKATSGIWCFNHRNTKYFHKKKNQFYIQTWHGDICLKAIEKKAISPNEIDSNPYVKKSVIDSAMTDVLIVGSEWGYRNMKESFFFENGEYLKIGSPRNDILINHKKDFYYNSVRDKLGISRETKICLFAPTFRKDFKIENQLFSSPNVSERLIESLKFRFGGNWVIVIKYHPACLNVLKTTGAYYCDNKKVFDVSDYGDISELLIASDSLITDYSSVCFDFGLTGKPCWLFFKDFKEYSKDDRDIIVNINDLGFPVCYDEKELLKSICEFNSDEYSKSLNEMYHKFGSYEKGKACEQLTESIRNYLEIKM